MILRSGISFFLSIKTLGYEFKTPLFIFVTKMV
jgi:hypothetical protein